MIPDGVCFLDNCALAMDCVTIVEGMKGRFFLLPTQSTDGFLSITPSV